MNISGIRPFEAIGYYNKNINSVSSIETGAEVLNAGEFIEDGRGELSTNEYVDSNPRQHQTETAYDFAKLYKPDVTYSLKGADSDLASLDKPAKSYEAPKDSVLSQYKTFVGNVRGNENFNL